MRTTALILAGTLLAPLAVHALPATTAATTGVMIRQEASTNGDSLEKAKARLEKAIKDRDAVLAQMKERGLDTEENLKLANEWAKVYNTYYAAEMAYNKAKYQAGNIETAKKTFDAATNKLGMAQEEFMLADIEYKESAKVDQQEIVKAESVVTRATAALENSKLSATNQLARGSLGFFEYEKDTRALQVFQTTQQFDGQPLPAYTRVGQSGDATSLDYMREAILRVNKLNELRARHGLPPLKISSHLMAIAQLNANVNVRAGTFDHIAGEHNGENIAGMNRVSDDPFQLWYDQEKALWDSGVRDFSKVGHYLNIIRDGVATTGFAIADPDKLRFVFFANTFGQTGSYGEKFLPAYTTAEYLQRFDSYVAGMKDAAANGTPEARDNLAKANSALNEAKKGNVNPAVVERLNKARAAEKAAHAEYEAAAAAYKAAQESQKNLSSLKDVFDSAKEKLSPIAARLDKADRLVMNLAAREVDIMTAREAVARFTPTPQPSGDTGNVFYVSNDWTSTQASSVFSYGRARDEVLVGDWNGDGTDTFAVRRGNMIYVKNSVDGGAADIAFSYGRVGDEILVGDFDGDGRDTFAVRRGNTFYVLNSLHSGNADQVINYGRYGDTVYAGDFDGDGIDTFAVRRGSTYFVKNHISSGIADHVFAYGRAGDATILGDFDGDGRDTFAVRRGNTIYVKNSLGAGNADSVLSYGRVSDELYVGDWDGNGTDTPAVRR